MKMKMAMSIVCLAMVGMLGCAYAPEDDLGLGYPVAESSKYALAPNVRWTSIRYGQWTPLSVEGVWEIRILMDSHRIQTVRFDDGWGMERPRIVKENILATNEWLWIVGQLEQAEVSRWKTSYQPGEGAEIFDGVSWHLEFVNGTNVVGKVVGYNAWPKKFKAFQVILDTLDVIQGGSCYVSPTATEEKAASPQ